MKFLSSPSRLHTLPNVPASSVRKTLNNNDLNHIADQRFSLTRWFAAGARSCRLRKTGSAYC